MNNSILDTENDVVARIAQRALAKREAGYASEARRLLSGQLGVIGGIIGWAPRIQR
jgi:hypothetical protein